MRKKLIDLQRERASLEADPVHRSANAGFLALVLAALLGVAGCRSTDVASMEPGPRVRIPPVDCTFVTAELDDPPRKVSRNTTENCLELRVEALRRALSESEAIDDFEIRSGRVVDVPPSAEWRSGRQGAGPEPPTFIVPVELDPPMRSRPHIITWSTHLEISVADGGELFRVEQEKVTPRGFEIHLTPLAGSEIYRLDLDWVAYTTTEAGGGTR